MAACVGLSVGGQIAWRRSSRQGQNQTLSWFRDSGQVKGSANADSDSNEATDRGAHLDERTRPAAVLARGDAEYNASSRL